MSIPYRTQQRLKRLAGTLLVILVVSAIALGLWFLCLLESRPQKNCMMQVLRFLCFVRIIRKLPLTAKRI